MSKLDELAAVVAAQGEEIAALHARLAAQTPARKAIPAPRIEEGGVRFLIGAAAGELPVELPTDAELLRLRAIVDAAYPHLAFRPRRESNAHNEVAEDKRGFAQAFAWLSQQGRADKVDGKKATSWYVGNANQRQRELGQGTDVNGQNFVAALLAHGDISFTRLDDYPIYGLTFPGAGRQYAAQWRAVLATGQLLEPVANPRPRPLAPAPSQLLMVGAGR